MTDRWTEPKPPHGSPEWLAARHRDKDGRPRLTASVAAVLFDEHPFVTPAVLATQMLSETPPESSESDAIERGHDLEPVLLERWHRRNPGRVAWSRPPEVMYCAGRWVANLDGLCREERSLGEMILPATVSACPLEAKTAKGVVDDLKPYWVWQGVAQRYCLNGTPGRVEWAWYDSDFVFKQATQWVTQDEMDELVRRGDEWLSYIDLDMLPPSVVLSAQQVATLHPEPDKEAAIELPAGTTKWIAQLQEARAATAAAKEREDEAKEHLAPLLAKTPVGRWQGVDVISWKPSKPQEGFDTATFKAEHPDLWAKYQKTSPGSRTMRILKGFDGGGEDDGEPF